jgi:hypothetical protein
MIISWKQRGTAMRTRKGQRARGEAGGFLAKGQVRQGGENRRIVREGPLYAGSFTVTKKGKG